MSASSRTEWKLPPSVIYNHGAYFLIHKTQWIKLGRNISHAIKKFRAIAPQLKGSAYAKKYVYADGDTASGPIPRRFLGEMLRNARKNAKARGLECSLSIEILEELAIKCGGVCSLTGIRFEYGVSKEAADSHSRRKRLWAPSIDRINPAAGYTANNIRLVCTAMNIARQEFSDDVFEKIAVGFIKTAKDRNQAAPRSNPSAD